MRVIFFTVLLSLASCAAYAQEAAPTPVTSNDILPYLERMTGWSRAVTAADQLADTTREAVIRDKLQQDAQTILQKSFTFARAEAAIVEIKPAASPATPNESDSKANDVQSRRNRMLKAADDADKHVVDVQAQLEQPGLNDAQREKLAGALKLAQARQSLLQTMLGVIGSEGDGTLLDQVNALARTVLPVSPDLPKANVTETLPAKQPQANSGIFGLSDTLLTLSRKKEAIDALLARTQKMADATRALMAPMRAGLHDALAQGDALTTGNEDAAGLAAYRQSVDTLVEHYKQLSDVVIPLGEINALLANTQQNLQDWNRMVAESSAHISHNLLIRISLLALSLAAPLICSSLAHSAIRRYVKDTRRRKQLEITRRVLLIVALILAMLVNFITEFGSLATFAGFMTAGLAVALQTVLVSMVAHSFYFGRYGLHVGDKVKVDNVIGEVIQLGLLRLYIRELKETDKGLEPTGKIVAFPNSVMFQPSAFFQYADNQDFA